MNSVSIFSVSLISLYLVAPLAFAQNNSSMPASYELTCRAKAKEIAAETYRGCITESKKTHIEQIRNEYQQKLKALKDEYEMEVKKLTGQNSGSSQITTQDTSEEVTVAPAKKSKAKMTSKKQALPAKKKIAKSQSEINPPMDDVSVQLKSSGSSGPTYEESTMDLPEPIPVENLSSDNG
jgi:hypothetical protein